jgi:hypothetical protein
VGREIEVVVLANGGYKQPQQLTALCYALALGCEFDCVVNLDGYNDAVLAGPENVPFGVHPILPRSWNLLAGHVKGVEGLAILGRIVAARMRRKEWVETMREAPFALSITAQLLWKVRDRGLAGEVHAALTALHEYAERQAAHVPYGLAGPAPGRPETDDLVAWLADVWERCSEQLAGICRANGTLYLHFLQPNQYAGEPKPMTDAERLVALLPPGADARVAVERGYPPLVAAGERLRSKGVAFEDLRAVFAGVEEPLYVDLFCHVNRRANEILAVRIAGSIAAACAAGLPRGAGSGRR